MQRLVTVLLRRSARSGAARRAGRRPRGVVGEGVLRPGGRGGQGDHRRLRAGDRQAGRARLPSTESFRTRSRRRSRPASRPTSPSAYGLATYIPKWALEDRLVDLSDAVGHFSDLFDPDQLDRAMLLNARTGQKALYGLPIGQLDQPHPRLEEPAGARGLHARRHSQGVGARSGRSGATRSSRRCARHWAATTSGASACPCRSRPTTP